MKVKTIRFRRVKQNKKDFELLLLLFVGYAATRWIPSFLFGGFLAIVVYLLLRLR